MGESEIIGRRRNAICCFPLDLRWNWMDLAALIFLVTLAVETVGWIGKDTLAELASPFRPHSRRFAHTFRIQFFPLTTLFSTSPYAKRSRTLKTEILKLKSELAATSSQDEFAKWAKLRRKSDKAIADLELLSTSSYTTCSSYRSDGDTPDTSVAGNRTAFATKFKGLLWVLTTILPFVVSSWHRKEAVYYLPHGWFGPTAWPMGLPSAPAGSFALPLRPVVADHLIDRSDRVWDLDDGVQEVSRRAEGNRRRFEKLDGSESADSRGSGRCNHDTTSRGKEGIVTT